MNKLKRHIAFILFVICFLCGITNSNAQVRSLFSDSGVVLTSGTLGGDNLTFGDINDDGNTDLIYGWRNRSICYVSMNQGNGVFKEPKRIPYGAADLNVGAIGLSDITGNGNLDIVFANPGANSIDLYENLGHDSFSSRRIISSDVSYAIGLFICDIDGDLDNDILATAPWEKEIVLLENLGNGAFSSKKVISTVADRSESIFCADLDNDGDLDLVSPSWGDGKIIWYENYGNGQFSSTDIISDGILYANFVCAADLDGDGYKDIISGGYGNVYWHKNEGDKTFASKIKLTNNVVTGYNAGGGFNIISVDLDQDNDVDLVVSSAFYHNLVWLENNGDATFQKEQVINDNCHPLHETISSKIISADLDNDGDLDIAIAIGKDKEIVWYENHLNDPSVKGVVYYDENGNGKKDADERGLGGTRVNIEPNSLGKYSDKKGGYTYFLEKGEYKVILDTLSIRNWKLSSDFISYEFSVLDSAYALKYDFGIVPLDTFSKVEVFTQNGFPRCSTSVLFSSVVKNLGTTINNGMVWVKIDHFTKFGNFLTEPDSLIGDSLAGWIVSELYPREDFELAYYLEMPAIDSGFSIGDKVRVQTFFIDENQDSSVHILDLLIRCSYDPNDKLAETSQKNGINYILKGDKLLYTIRFQNSGNDTAFNVVIKDTLNEKLDVNSLEIINSSHSDNMTVEISQNRVLIFRFNDIKLPDSTTNYSGSQGFVTFRVSTVESIEHNDIVQNTGYIYFDSNPAILTNNVKVTYWDSIPTLSIAYLKFDNNIKIYPNPAMNELILEFDQEQRVTTTLKLMDSGGKEVHSGIINPGVQMVNIDLSRLSKGVYFIQICTNKKAIVEKFVKY